MSTKQVSLPTVILLLLSLTPVVMACCGHCHWGHQTKKAAQALSEKDSIAIQNFSESNEELLNKIRHNNDLIKEEYQKENPDYDRIATLKKQRIDYHTELEKKAAKRDLAKHHHSWCPMHQ